jgi:hypothetical protein
MNGNEDKGSRHVQFVHLQSALLPALSRTTRDQDGRVREIVGSQYGQISGLERIPLLDPILRLIESTHDRNRIA